MTLAGGGFEKYGKTTRRAAFLAEMERVMPWGQLCALIEPHGPKTGSGPMGQLAGQLHRLQSPSLSACSLH